MTDSLENFSNYFFDIKNNNPVIVKIPKATFNSMAGGLDTLLRNACQLPARGPWEKHRPDLTQLRKSKTKLLNAMACTGLPELSPRGSSHVHM